MSKVSDIKGRRFGRWLVIRRNGKTPAGQAQWYCRCDCGKRSTVPGANLRQGLTQSCGCLKVEKQTKHGMSNTPMHHVWIVMRFRCENQSDRNYHRYGGRGIKVCDRWSDFTKFLSDMGPCPPKMTLDRINNDGDYEPSNCRWATRMEQSNNTRRNRFVAHQGKTLTVSQWARELNVPRGRIDYLLKTGRSLDAL